MLAVNTDKKIAIYSLGKTGTTTLIDTLPNDWHTTGEISADFMHTLFPNVLEPGYVGQYNALQHLYSNDYNITIVIRQPWKRYVSGIKEVLQDQLNTLYNDPINEVYANVTDEVLTKSRDRLFYLSEFKRQKDFEFAVDFPYPSDFAIHHNYHVRNWLHTIQEFDATIIDCTNLNDYITNSLGYTPAPRTNVSDPAFIKRLDTCIKNTEIYFYIEKYLESEISTYQNLIR